MATIKNTFAEKAILHFKNLKLDVRGRIHNT